MGDCGGPPHSGQQVMAKWEHHSTVISTSQRLGIFHRSWKYEWLYETSSFLVLANNSYFNRKLVQAKKITTHTHTHTSTGLIQPLRYQLTVSDLRIYLMSVQFSSVAQSCPTLRDPTNRSTPGLPVHHQLPEFTQTHIHQVSDAIQPSHT